MAEELELRNGERVWVRPIEPEDADGLRLAFQELSEQSRYQRFFTGTPRLTDVMVEVLIHVDHVDREALVAVPTASSRTPVGVIRFARDPIASQRADLAVTVADAWHGRGLATALLHRLSARACQLGIEYFTVDMLADNASVRSLVRAAGGVQQGLEGGIVSAHIPLSRAEHGHTDVSSLLRASALGVVGPIPRDVAEREPSLPVTSAVLLPGAKALAGLA
ncbi:MAG TPA: GNAT family N-acetyltransferase [Nocardioides sp.]|nr:GNAT family N-acetyltransferase [Nocardioides sp.]